ncbi:MAG: hypothetical protein J6A59_01110 [Lachnospiraceae bacterium]|nr:hypothetical protein [Lachnospiraceae bacterium]
MAKLFKKLTIFTLCFSMLFSLTACGTDVEKVYQSYIKSLIAINYMGATEDYIKASGATQEEADNLYQANVEYLADNIITYYGITITDAPELREDYIELARLIYSKCNYSVSKARRDGSVYLVDVIIYPMNLFVQTSEQVSAYVDNFNQGVKDGVYNDYTLSQYETEFSKGMVEILSDGALNMTYGEPVTITVEIVEEGDTYCISDRDFMRIDAAMITSAVEPPETTETTEE